MLLTLRLTGEQCGGHNTCSQAHIGGSDLFSVMSKRNEKLVKALTAELFS